MDRALDLYCSFLKFLIALCLAVMVVLVFGNVFLRYGFNSGITVSEELSRWLLVWLTFLGAIGPIVTNFSKPHPLPGFVSRGVGNAVVDAGLLTLGTVTVGREIGEDMASAFAQYLPPGRDSV